MVTQLHNFFAVVAGAISIMLTGCGGDSSGFTPYVSDISAQEHLLRINQETRVDIDFAVLDNMGSIEGADVVVLLPKQLGYVEGSSRISDSSSIFNHTSSRSPDRITNCTDGSTLLHYNFEATELIPGSNSLEPEYGTVDQNFRIRVMGKEVTDSTVILARGGDFLDLSDDCSTVKPGKPDEQFQVVG